MALDFELPHFPYNVINALAVGLKFIDPDIGQPGDSNYVEGIRVFKRPLQISDDTEAIGLFPLTWEPDEKSYEMMGRRSEPTLQNYSIGIQGMIIDSDEERGIALHSVLSSRIRHQLQRDSALGQALPQLKVTLAPSSGNTTEKLAQWRVNRQQFLNSELSGRFIFLSTLELGITTEFE